MKPKTVTPAENLILVRSVQQQRAVPVAKTGTSHPVLGRPLLRCNQKQARILGRRRPPPRAKEVSEIPFSFINGPGCQAQRTFVTYRVVTYTPPEALSCTGFLPPSHQLTIPPVAELLQPRRGQACQSTVAGETPQLSST